MPHASPLPEYLVKRYHGWKATTFSENRGWYRRLAEEGQRPRAMVITCCDSRVNVLSIFSADQGEFFVHRNIANLVPPFEEDGAQRATSAAVEYAVTVLKVSHVLVLGHSLCGGVMGCYDMCDGHAPELENKSSFVGRWLDILRPRFGTLPEGDRQHRLTTFEKAAVQSSLENLMTFPFVRSAVEREALSLHGLWTDIGDGRLEQYDATRDGFVPI